MENEKQEDKEIKKLYQAKNTEDDTNSDTAASSSQLRYTGSGLIMSGEMIIRIERK